MTIPQQRQSPEPHTPAEYPTGPTIPAPEPRQWIATTVSGAQLLITLFPDDDAPRVQARIGTPWPSSAGTWHPGYVVREVS